MNQGLHKIETCETCPCQGNWIMQPRRCVEKDWSCKPSCRWWQRVFQEACWVPKVNKAGSNPFKMDTPKFHINSAANNNQWNSFHKGFSQWFRCLPAMLLQLFAGSNDFATTALLEKTTEYENEGKSKWQWYAQTGWGPHQEKHLQKMRCSKNRTFLTQGRGSRNVWIQDGTIAIQKIHDEEGIVRDLRRESQQFLYILLR